MPKTIADRFHKLEAGVGEHIRRYLRAEEGAREALAGVRKETRRFIRKAWRGPATESHKDAVRYTQLGIAHYNAGEYADAEERFRRAVEMDPKYARAHYDLGNTCYKRGHLTEAVTAWREAIDAAPRSEIADSAREKLLLMGHGKDGLVDTIKEQMLHRR